MSLKYLLEYHFRYIILPANKSAHSPLVGFVNGSADTGKEVEIPHEDKIVVDEAGNDAKMTLKVTLVVGFKATSGDDVDKEGREEEEGGKEGGREEEEGREEVVIEIVASGGETGVGRHPSSFFLRNCFIPIWNSSRAGLPVVPALDIKSVAKPGVPVKSHTFGPPVSDGSNTL